MKFEQTPPVKRHKESWNADEMSAMRFSLKLPATLAKPGDAFEQTARSAVPEFS